MRLRTMHKRKRRQIKKSLAMEKMFYQWLSIALVGKMDFDGLEVRVTDTIRPLPIDMMMDGVKLEAGYSVLVRNTGSQESNGIYRVSGAADTETK
jgi:hypothetical protein